MFRLDSTPANLPVLVQLTGVLSCSILIYDIFLHLSIYSFLAFLILCGILYHSNSTSPPPTPSIPTTVPIQEHIRQQKPTHLKIESLCGDTVEYVPNSRTPLPFENEYFKGELLFLLKTTPPDPTWDHMFEGKRRLFWVQIQGQFKTAPRGIVYMGGEVRRPMKLGLFTSSICRLLLQVVKSLVAGIHYSFGENTGAEDEELPHILFPLHTAVDQFVVTPAEDYANRPKLGSKDFGETEAQRRQRRKSFDINKPYPFNTTDTYSFFFHSYFVNFNTWQVVSVPGMNDMDLKTFWYDMPIRLVAYEVDPGTADAGRNQKKQKHYTNTNRYFFKFQLSHESILTPDPQPVMNVEGKNCSEELRKLTFDIPYWFEYYNTNTNDRRVCYVFVVSSDTEPMKYLLHTPSIATAPVVHCVNKKFQSKGKKTKYHRIEQERQNLISTLKQLIDDASMDAIQQNARTNLYELLTSSPSTVDSELLEFFGRRYKQDLNINVSRRMTGTEILCQSEIVRLVWDTRLQQQWLLCTPTDVLFYAPCTNAPCDVVAYNDIISIKQLVEKELLPSFISVEIETIHHCHVFAFATEDQFNLFRNLIELQLVGRDIEAELQEEYSCSEAMAIRDYVQHKYKSKRRILNDRTYTINSTLSPCDLVRAALHTMLSLTVHSNLTNTQVIHCLNLCSTLQQVQLNAKEFTENDRLSFFLNLYHLIILHARLFDLLPESKAQWSKVFNETCYEVGAYVFSLAEIEHCILRSNMTPPRLPIASFLLPKFSTLDPRRAFEIQNQDFRLNLVLNCTSNSCSEYIAVFTPQSIQDQINTICSIMLNEAIAIDPRKSTIYLPKVCDWYRHDFGETPMDALRKIWGFLQNEKWDQVNEILHEQKLCHVKYQSYDFHFRTTIQEWKLTS